MKVLLSEEQNQNLDSFIDNHIGQGKAQIVLCMPLFLMLFSQGCQSAVLGIMLPQLQKEWEISDMDKSLLMGLVFLGITLGSALNSFADKFGRYITISSSCYILTIFGMLSCFCFSFHQFAFIRFVYGIGMGISFPMAGTYLSEISTTQYRGTIISLICILWAIGATLASICGWFLLSGFHWRILFFIIGIPSIIALYIHKKYGKQSLRHLIIHQKYEEAVQFIMFSKKLNENTKPFSQQMIKSITIKQKPSQSSIFQLVSKQYWAITLTLSSQWVAMAFIYYAITLLLPLILSPIVHNQNWRYFIICSVSLIQIGSYKFAIFLMENKSLGRKNSLILNLVIICGMSFLSSLVTTPFYFIVVFGSMKLCTEAFSMILFTYTAQCYPTTMRAKAMSFVAMTGRISTIFMGLIGISALKWLDGNGLYLIFFMLSGFSIILLCRTNKETLGQSMDQ